MNVAYLRLSGTVIDQINGFPISTELLNIGPTPKFGVSVLDYTGIRHLTMDKYRMTMKKTSLFE